MMGTIIISILQIRELMKKDAKYIAQQHTVPDS